MKQRARAVTEQPGWKETARADRSVEEPGRPARGWESHSVKETEPERESEKPGVAKKSGNADGAKGL
jgi:hypothetical protein